MPLRRTAPPDPDVAARLAQVLPAVRTSWVLPAPDPGLPDGPARPSGPRAARSAGDQDDWAAAVGPAHERLVEQTRAAGRWGDEPGVGPSWRGESRPAGRLGTSPGEPWSDRHTEPATSLPAGAPASPSDAGPPASSSHAGAAASWLARSTSTSSTTMAPASSYAVDRPGSSLAQSVPGSAEADPVVASPQPTTPASDRPSALELWRSGRVSPGRRGVLALGLVALLACLLTVFFVVRGRPQEVVVPAVVAPGVTVPGSAAAGDPAAGEPATGPEVVVAVGGRVRRPGIVRLPAGSRVDDAVKAAGGAVRPRDLALVNVARRLVDGEQVLVGVDAPEQPVAPGAGAGAAAPGGPLDLNTATLAQLDALPGIGPVLAQRILDWRTEHGRFGSVDQLREVSGIGEATYADLQGQVRV